MNSKFAADQYAGYKWLGWMYCPSSFDGGLFCYEGLQMTKSGFYVIKEVELKARKVVAMLKRGVKFTPTQPDVISMLNKLKL